MSVPDRAEDVTPYAYGGSRDDDDDDEEEEGDGDENPEGAWTLRKCAASTLDAASRAFPFPSTAVLDALLPLVAEAFNGGSRDDDGGGGPKHGGAPASAPLGVWEREAAILAPAGAATRVL